MINILPTHISNLIAAGEVVQRPASVVKELMENAVDAGSDSINVIVKDSGKSLIQVIDNGCGMSIEDARVAFERHATSKISQIQDLSAIHTFGFRGEALASIAAVSDIILQTKTSSAESGYEIKISESNIYSENAINCSKGCNFMVRNIFYNIPARRKFLKSDTAEYRNIVSEFIRVALTRPQISFTLTHNERDIYNLPSENRKQRIVRIFGNDMTRELAPVEVETTIVKIGGYVGAPESSRKTSGNQYLFINNRFFRSSYFQKAITKAYEGLIPDGNIPSFFIFFETDPSKIDVNIHPAKTEIKFEDDYTIFDILHSAVRESIGRNAFAPCIDFDTEGAPDIPVVKKSLFTPMPKINFDPLFNPFEQEYHPREEGPPPQLFDNNNICQNQLLKISNKYILTTITSGVILIDMRRASERILYDRFSEIVNSNSIPIHKTLFPKTLELSELQLNIIEEYNELLLNMGFEITRNDRNSISLTGVPESLIADQENIEKIIDDILTELSTLSLSGDVERGVREKIIRRLCASAAIHKNYSLNSAESQSLIDTLFSCKEPNITPSGERCMTVISLEELAKLLN